jgi:undecaprenyl-diphosphatase
MTDTANPPAPEPSRLKTMLELDARWSAILNISQHSGWLRNLLRFLAHSGDSWFMIPVMGLVWLLGDGLWKWRMLVMFIAVCITALTAVALKRVIGRSRPVGDWGLIYRSTDPHSFPSGHAARMVMLAVFTLALGPGWLCLLFIIWAPLVMVARVAMGVHYLSDVAGGAVLGLLFGVLFVAVL